MMFHEYLAQADWLLRRERDWVLGEFKAGRSPILIATDVASRGLGMFSFSFFERAARDGDVPSEPPTRKVCYAFVRGSNPPRVSFYHRARVPPC